MEDDTPQPQTDQPRPLKRTNAVFHHVIDAHRRAMSGARKSSSRRQNSAHQQTPPQQDEN